MPVKLTQAEYTSTAVDTTAPTVLAFYGPFTFTGGSNYLFSSPFAANEGIYIWTIRDEVNGINYVHYIGETLNFAKRHKEHLLQLSGLNYRILDAHWARQGVEKVLWNGLWRDRTPEAAARLLEHYGEVSKMVVDYIGIINIYFAPTGLPSYLRRHLEGRIGQNLRNNYPGETKFYPADNQLRPLPKMLGLTVTLRVPEAIAGIDTQLAI